MGTGSASTGRSGASALHAVEAFGVKEVVC